MSIIPTTQYEELRIRVSSGKYETFPFIDNKGLFVIRKSCKGKTGFLLETFNAEDKSYYGIYTCANGMAILTSAFSSDEVITKSVALLILKSFPYLFAKLKVNLKEIFPDLKVSLHMQLVEPYFNTVYLSIKNELIRFATIKDPRNLTESELYILSAIPDLAEKIVKIHE